MICSGRPILIRAWMQQVSILRKKYGIEVIWVTSGAIATAVDFMIDRGKFSRGKRTLAEKQALSAIGQPLVLDLYTLGLHSQGLAAAQVLLTYEDLADKTRRENFQNTVEQLLEWNVTPILNENDAVATQEIRFGDNDSLSARVAKAVSADRLIILTDVEGLYESDPRTNPSARLVPVLTSISPKLIKKVEQDSKVGTARGTGGMHSKLLAAKLASDNGVRTHLVKGDELNILVEIALGNLHGTTVQGKRRKKKR